MDNMDYIDRGTQLKTVYLTFDDGPCKYTKEILRILKEYNAKATFFLLEPNMKNYDYLVKKMVEYGHGVGLHGVTHIPGIIYKSADVFLEEMRKCSETLKMIAGIESNLVRAPYGSYTCMDLQFKKRVVKSGYKLWDWHIDSTDSLNTNLTVERIIKTVIENVAAMEKKGIDPVILFHGQAITLQALGKILPFLKEKGYIMEALNSNMEAFNFWDSIDTNYEKHIVAKGETLRDISQNTGLTVEEIKRFNKLKNDDVYAGQVIYTNLKKYENKMPSILISKGGKNIKEIALTYDSGFKDTETSAILKVLKRHNVKCTFFITGIWAELFPDLAKRIVKEGHELGNHSYKHPDMKKISYDTIVKSVKEGEAAIREITGVETRPLFREPYGEWNDDVLKAVGDAGYKYSIYWSIDTLDWQLPEARIIVNRILKKAGNGDIVLMHVAGKNTAAATDIAVRNLKARGFKLVTVGEMLKKL